MKDYSRFITELTTGRFFIQEGALNKYLLNLLAMAQGKVMTFPDLPELKMSMYDGMGMPMNDDKQEEKESVAIIPIHGVLTRYGSWYDYGSEDLAKVYNAAWENPAITAVITNMDCLGGNPEAFFPLAEAFAKKNKPLICAVTGGCYSLGYLAACHHDKIISINDMAKIGSIGVVAQYIDMNGAYEKMGGKVYEVYPPESDWKNKPIRDLKKGDESTLIKEELSPWAQYFQQNVIDHRKKLNMEMEGVLSGRTFFSNYGELTAKAAGLIDDIMPMDNIIQYAFNLSKTKQLKSFFN